MSTAGRDATGASAQTGTEHGVKTAMAGNRVVTEATERSAQVSQSERPRENPKRWVVLKSVWGRGRSRWRTDFETVPVAGPEGRPFLFRARLLGTSKHLVAVARLSLG